MLAALAAHIGLEAVIDGGAVDQEAWIVRWRIIIDMDAFAEYLFASAERRVVIEVRRLFVEDELQQCVELLSER